MNVKTFVRTRKNVAHWAAYILKMESRDEVCEANRAEYVEAVMARDDELSEAEAAEQAAATFAMPPPLTDVELDDLEGRKAQCTVWIRELRNATEKGLTDGDIPGEISASSSAATTESAGATAGAET